MQSLASLCCNMKTNLHWKYKLLFAKFIQELLQVFTIDVFHHGKKVAEVKWNIVGQHNMHNALMAIAAAYHAGVKIEDACQALGSFINAKRRLEVKGEVNSITVYDDFAHHPEAILAVADSLEQARAAIPRGLQRLDRLADDDPVIVETWIYCSRG